MPAIRKGSCIGIKYVNPLGCNHMDQSKKYCIHNGNFSSAVINGKRVEQFNTSSAHKLKSISFWHVGKCNHTPMKPTTVGNIRDVKIIPAFNFSYKYPLNALKPRNLQSRCIAYRPGSKEYDANKNNPSRIMPTQGIAICYRNGQGQDVHNGRYLYWVDTDHKAHCVLRLNQNPNRILRIWYSHMNFDKSGNLIPQIRYREHIVRFSKLRRT